MRKNKLIVMLFTMVVALMLLFTNGIESQAASKRVRMGKAYAKIIKSYKDVYRLAKEGSLDDVDDEWVNADFAVSVFENPEAPNNLVYCIKDYNGDGIEELFIGTVYKDQNNKKYAYVCDLYTFHKGKAVSICDFCIGYRVNCFLQKKGVIAIYSISVQQCTWYFYKLPKKKSKLKLIMRVDEYDETSYQAAYYEKIVNGKTKRITKKERDRIVKKYSKPQKLTFCKPTNKAIRNIKKGKFTYKGQKKYKLVVPFYGL